MSTAIWDLSFDLWYWRIFFWQYSHYATSGDVTPAEKLPAPILSTIGGEQGGRAPIVIQDKNLEAAVLDDTVTIADQGKAQPGRDIFAGNPVKDIKSDTLPVQPPEPVREQKEISSVIVGTLTSSSTSPSSDSGSLSSSSSSDSRKGTEESTSPAMEAEAAKQRAGPLGEAELEAQKVANELYPDAADK